MELNDLINKLNQLDTSADAISEGLELIINALNDGSKLSRQIERDFFGKMTKGVINLIAKGDQQSMSVLLDNLHDKITEDDELNNPFGTIPPKQRFAAHLNHIAQTLNIYLRSDFEAKDYSKFMSAGKVQNRLRELTIFLYSQETYFTSEDIKIFYSNLNLSEAAILKKLERDINSLVSSGIVQKFYNSPKDISYKLAPKAFFYQKQIFKLQQDEEPVEEINDTEIVVEEELRNTDQEYFLKTFNEISMPSGPSKTNSLLHTESERNKLPSEMSEIGPISTPKANETVFFRL